MLPFLIEMSSLFERFVAEWLRMHMADTLLLRYQEPVVLGGQSGLDFRIDMVVYDRTSGEARSVVDAKYKAPERVDQADFNQVVVYAKAKHCSQAFLVYPVPLAKPLDVWVGEIRVRSATFSLDKDLDTGGQELLHLLSAA
jgi:5-methylcytosine-specific restriction enzyme subunit McrC